MKVIIVLFSVFACLQQSMAQINSLAFNAKNELLAFNLTPKSGQPLSLKGTKPIIDQEPNTEALPDPSIRFTIHPNPVIDYLHIEANRTVEIQLSDASGYVLIPFVSGKKLTLDLSGLEVGMYHLQIKDGVQFNFSNVVVKK